VEEQTINILVLGQGSLSKNCCKLALLGGRVVWQQNIGLCAQEAEKIE
jgi:hypothetical protein